MTLKDEILNIRKDADKKGIERQKDSTVIQGTKRCNLVDWAD